MVSISFLKAEAQENRRISSCDINFVASIYRPKILDLGRGEGRHLLRIGSS